MLGKTLIIRGLFLKAYFSQGLFLCSFKQFKFFPLSLYYSHWLRPRVHKSVDNNMLRYSKRTNQAKKRNEHPDQMQLSFSSFHFTLFFYHSAKWLNFHFQWCNNYPYWGTFIQSVTLSKEELYRNKLNYNCASAIHDGLALNYIFKKSLMAQ